MTNARDLMQMRTVCDARYAQMQQKFADVLAREGKLRAELARLSDMALQGTSQNDQAANMRAIGADVIWQGWLGRTKAELNMELAQVLATKEKHIHDVRQAYGKVMVVRKMQDDLKADSRKQAAKTALSLAIELSTLTKRQ